MTLQPPSVADIKEGCAFPASPVFAMSKSALSDFYGITLAAAAEPEESVPQRSNTHLDSDAFDAQVSTRQ